MSEPCDILVLGAGIVGASTALNLQRRGRHVTLLDRRAPGEETSYGNAGVIEGGIYLPLAFPREIGSLLRYSTNREPAVHFHWSFLPRIAPWLWALRRNSSLERLRRNGAAIMSLTAAAIGEHKAHLAEAGASALMRETGWLKIYHTQAAFEADRLERQVGEETGHDYQVLGVEGALELEPHLKPSFLKAVLWHDVASVSDPGAVTAAVADLFVRAGGEVKRGEARRLTPAGGGWHVETADGVLEAREVVVAMGPWSMDLLTPLGYRFPFAVKRGYHRHYLPQGNAGLSRVVVDGVNGFAMAPMARGIRVTTGIEFAPRDAPPTPVQMARAESHARTLFPLAEGVEAEPWMGRRPCFPDTLPVIGEAPRHPGLWLNFGHAHLGFTLGPVTGRLLAEIMTGAAPFADAGPFAPTRF